MKWQRKDRPSYRCPSGNPTRLPVLKQIAILQNDQTNWFDQDFPLIPRLESIIHESVYRSTRGSVFQRSGAHSGGSRAVRRSAPNMLASEAGTHRCHAGTGLGSDGKVRKRLYQAVRRHRPTTRLFYCPLGSGYGSNEARPTRECSEIPGPLHRGFLCERFMPRRKDIRAH